MKRRLLLSCLLLAGFSCRQSSQEDILTLLNAQVEAWNRGDVEGYMEGYWNSPELTFVSGGAVRKGYQDVLERYRTAYSTREQMGMLSFSDLAVREIASDAVVVTGEWRLVRSADEPWGRFTLLVQRKPEGWRITYDHTSVASE